MKQIEAYFNGVVGLLKTLFSSTLGIITFIVCGVLFAFVLGLLGVRGFKGFSKNPLSILKKRRGNRRVRRRRRSYRRSYRRRLSTTTRLARLQGEVSALKAAGRF